MISIVTNADSNDDDLPFFEDDEQTKLTLSLPSKCPEVETDCHIDVSVNVNEGLVENIITRRHW